MAAYGLDISEVMAWTYPQLRLMRKARDQRANDERRWNLFLASGTLAPEMFDQLWQVLGGDKLNLKSPDAATAPQSYKAGEMTVDDEGNVVAPPGTPLLSDIATGKAMAPPLIPITKMKIAAKESDGVK
jgi:hypothetical protein